MFVFGRHCICIFLKKFVALKILQTKSTGMLIHNLKQTTKTSVLVLYVLQNLQTMKGNNFRVINVFKINFIYAGTIALSLLSMITYSLIVTTEGNLN